MLFLSETKLPRSYSRKSVTEYNSLLHYVSYILSLKSCLLHSVSCIMPYIMSLKPSLLNHVSYILSLASCLLKPVSYIMSFKPRLLNHVSYIMSLASCLLQHVS